MKISFIIKKEEEKDLNIKQYGIKAEKKIRDLACSFFNNDEDVDVFISFEENEKIAYAFCKIKYEDKEYFGEYVYNTNTYTFRKYHKKYVESAVLKAFYIGASQIKKIKLPWGVMCGVRPAKNVRTFAEDGFSKEEIAQLFEEIYGVSGEKFELAYKVYQNEKDLIAKKGDRGISVYIGIPFCPTRCFYCSFVSTDMRYSRKYVDDFCKNLLEEIKITAKIIENTGVYIKNIYIGGGTPTSLDEKNLEKILECINKNFKLQNLKEYTLEAGRVDTITKEKLEIAKKYGVNRISINPQTMHNKTLAAMNRNTTREEILWAFSIANEVGFECINADLIAGLPGEEFDDFKESLEKIMRLYPQNITVHTMCLKRAAALRLSDVNLTSGREVSEMIQYSQKRLEEFGYKPYYMYRQKYMIGNLENVGYTKPGFESDYNINIMEENETIIALGGGASSKIVTENGIERIFNFKDPIEYINNFEEIKERKKKIEILMKGGEE